MNKFYNFLLFALLIIAPKSYAQRLDNEKYSPWFIGANLGAAWQSTDIQNKTNYGWGLVLGRTYNRRDGNVLSFDFKFRYLGGAWRGQNLALTPTSDIETGVLTEDPTNYKDNSLNVVRNFQTKSHEFNLELSMHFNRLTERTGWDPYLLAGIGASIYRAKGNLLDANGQMYDYDALEQINKTSLKNLLNTDYESPLDGSTAGWNGAIMPHLGLGIGYYLTPNFTIGLEHKTTFSRGDKFDGLASNIGKFKTDLYHYTNLYFKVYFRRIKWNTGREESYSPAPPITTPCNAPRIVISTASNSTVNHPEFVVYGSLQNASLSQFNSTLNGTQTGNLSQQNNQSFSSTYHLQQGLNTIVLSASTNCGTDSQTIYVNYVPACDQPIVSFTNPRTLSTSSTTPSYTAQAYVSNLGNGVIQYYVNGVQSSNYSYNSNSGLLTSNLTLQNGTNTVQIIASNNCGSHSQNVTINYDRVCPTPIFTNIGQVSSNVSSTTLDFSTYIRNISSANQIEVFLNGRSLSSGTYQVSSERFYKQITLNRGSNNVVVRATNTCGTIEQTWQYNVEDPCISPTISITNPAGARATSNTSQYTIQALLSNIDNPSLIQLKLNGNTISSFNFNTFTGLFTAQVTLNAGGNYAEIYTSNKCGSASAGATITYSAPCEKPILAWINPSANASISSTAQFDIQLKAENINNASDLLVKLNGTTVTTGSYNANTKIYRATVMLNKGSNSFEVTATNYCGTASGTSAVTYKGETVVVGTKPVIDLLTQCNVITTAGKKVISGNITGVQNTSQISIKVQNEPYSNIQYTAISNGFAFSFELNLTYSQAVVIEVIASNHIGQTSKVCQFTTEAAPVIDKDMIICHKLNGLQQTIVIKESQWETYSKLGATKGACPEVVDNDIQICLKNVTLTIKESQWNTYSSMGAVKGKCPEAIDNEIIICVPKGKDNVTMTIKESQWAEYLKQGATLGECPQVVDNDIIICTYEGRARVNMTIKESQWPQYQAAGATLGECPVYDPEITICVRDGSNLTTKIIKESEWPKYQAMGAYVGECPVVVDPEITICYLNAEQVRQTIVIKQSQWETYKAAGATMGACIEIVDQKLDICVNNGKERVTMTILESQWPDYEKLGATRGKCPVIVDKDVVICIPTENGKVTKTVKESQLNFYLDLGATVGECPVIIDKNITICVYENGKQTTKTIKESQWADYQKLGATLGQCVEVIDNSIEICLPSVNTKKTITIKESQWEQYRKMGATLGKCPTVVDKDIVICVPQNGQNVTKTIKESQWADYLKLGATRGECPIPVDKDIEICVKEGRVSVTKTIKESQWAYFESLGAKLGKCEIYDPEFPICLTQNGVPQTIIIKESQWPNYNSMGATIGACPESSTNNGQNSNSNQATSDGMLICILENGKYVTKTIVAKDWAKYQAQGATRGACTTDTNSDTEKVAPSRKPVFNDVKVNTGATEKLNNPTGGKTVNTSRGSSPTNSTPKPTTNTSSGRTVGGR